MKSSTYRKLICSALAAVMVITIIPVSDKMISEAAGKTKISKKTIKLYEGEKKNIVIKNKKKKAKYIFKSLNTKIAGVTKKGVVSGRKAGSTKIKVTEKSGKNNITIGTVSVTVRKKKDTAANGTSQAPDTTTAAVITPAANTATQIPNPSIPPVTPTEAATVKPTLEPLPTRTPLVLDDTSTPDGFNTQKTGVTYGTLERKTYHSSVTETDRKLIVITPPDYTNEKQYPVLYLCHGGNGDENDWLDPSGNPLYISGNLIASGTIEPMLIVLVNCRARANDGANPGDSLSLDHMKAWTDFLFEFQSDVMPYIENNYSILTGRDNTAMAGLSMGGRESLYIGFSIPDKIGYIGAFSPAFGIFEYENWGLYETGYFTEEEFKFPDEYMDNTTCLIMNGANDSMVRDEPERYHNALVDNNVNHYYYTIPGDHNMDVWKNGLYNFLKIVFR